MLTVMECTVTGDADLTTGGWVEPYISFHGLKITVTEDAGHLLSSDVDPLEYEVARRLMTREDLVLVAGSGMGSVATLLAAEFGARTVVAYEANPALVSATREWIQFSGGPLEIRHGALSTFDGVTRLRLAQRWPESTMHPEILAHQWYTDEWIEVPSVDTNRVVRRRGINALLLDVEGAEHDIIKVLDFRPLRWIVAEVHGDANEADGLLGILAEGGFTCLDRKSNCSPELSVISALKR